MLAPRVEPVSVGNPPGQHATPPKKPWLSPIKKIFPENRSRQNLCRRRKLYFARVKECARKQKNADAFQTKKVHPPSMGGVGWLRPLLFKTREVPALSPSRRPTLQITAPVFPKGGTASGSIHCSPLTGAGPVHRPLSSYRF